MAVLRMSICIEYLHWINIFVHGRLRPIKDNTSEIDNMKKKSHTKSQKNEASQGKSLRSFREKHKRRTARKSTTKERFKSSDCVLYIFVYFKVANKERTRLGCCFLALFVSRRE